MLGSVAVMKKKKSPGKYEAGQEVEWSINVNGHVAFTKSGRIDEVLGNKCYIVTSDTGARYRVSERVDGTLGAGD